MILDNKGEQTENSSNDNTINQEGLNDSAEITLNAIILEYEHTVQRAEKLDSKVGLLLTAISFIFAFSTANIVKASDVKISSTQDIILTVIIVLITALIIITYIILFNLLIPLLKGTGIHRLDPLDLFQADVFSLHKKVAARTIGTLYVRATTRNNNILEERFKKFNRCVDLVKPIIVLTIVNAILISFIY